MIPYRLNIPYVPPSALLPNARRRNHWRVTAQATKDARTVAWAWALANWEDGELAGDLHVEVHVAWPPGRRRCDVDALAGLAKPMLDGLTGKVWEDDRQITKITYSQGNLDKAGQMYWPVGVTSITVRRADDGADSDGSGAVRADQHQPEQQGVHLRDDGLAAVDGGADDRGGGAGGAGAAWPGRTGAGAG